MKNCQAEASSAPKMFSSAQFLGLEEKVLMHISGMRHPLLSQPKSQISPVPALSGKGSEMYPCASFSSVLGSGCFKMRHFQHLCGSLWVCLGSEEPGTKAGQPLDVAWHTLPPGNDSAAARTAALIQAARNSLEEF